MRPRSGYAQIVDPDRPVWERDTVSCGHCNKLIFVKPGSGLTVYLITHRDGRVTEEAGAFCRLCMKPVCLTCHDHGLCRPFERWLDEQEGTKRPDQVSISLHVPR